MRPHGRARIDPNRPQALAVCDRCGFQYNHVDLQWQMEWAGTRLVNKNLLVCSSCLDTPTPFLRTYVLPADPVPIKDPRAPDLTHARDNFLVTNGGETITDDTGSGIVTSTTSATDLLLDD